ncbi:MAG: hypothetical protein JNJ71_03795 [Rubrivivax sp.]|nr:hypothetical protein [Rubrivivax sp.]
MALTASAARALKDRPPQEVPLPARPDLAPAGSLPPLPGWPAAIEQAWQDAFDQHAAQGFAALRRAAAETRARLRRSQLDGEPGARALGLVAAGLKLTLGRSAYRQQGLAAWLMLQGRLAEMATGEGKTLAAGLAAATAALAGLRVHVMTANDYLVQRDEQLLRPLFELLGLGSAAIVTATPREQRLPAYREPIVYVTARELVFDQLKDHLALSGERDPRVLRARALGAPEAGPAGGAQAVVPPLEQAIVDEADSILLDEAVIPFILSVPAAPPDAVALGAARALALQCSQADRVLQPAQRQARLTSTGRHWLAQAVPAGSALWPLRLAQELVEAALVAEHLLQCGRDYVIVDGTLKLVDEITGRTAEGRQWSHPLHAMVEIKEGLAPSAALVTAARLTYQRFFPRYQRLGGMSGTLRESAGELRSLYACRVVPVPRTRPLQARWLGRRAFVDAAARQRACVARIGQMRQLGRPVLVGTGSVQESLSLSAALTQAGIDHQVLNALQDAHEAARVARAGEAACVTVTTNMAGRGTDIGLTQQALAAGGLHVILALSNRSRRIDRQLAGRCGRQGEPGSAETLLSLDDAVIVQGVPGWLRRSLGRLVRAVRASGELPLACAAALHTLAQRRAEWRERLLRRDLKLIDEGQGEQLAFAGRPE